MLEGLAWLNDHSETYSITFAQGLDETELLRRFGGNLAQARLIYHDDWDAIEELRLFGDVVQVGYCDGWAFAYEYDGYRSILPKVMRRVSAGTVAVSVLCSINADTFFHYAEDTKIVAGFDPLNISFDDASPRVQALLRQAGITREMVEDEENDYDFVGAMLALAEAVGARLDRASLTEKPLLTSFISNPTSNLSPH